MPPDDLVRQRIADLLARNRVVLFMKGEPRAPQCGFSAKAVAVLGELGIDYAHVDVLADAQLREGIKQFGNWPTIPQLYVDGELIGGSDIVVQMSQSGELHAALGLPPPDRTPPAISIGAAARDMLQGALAQAGDGHAVQLDVDPRFNTRLQLAPMDANAIAATVDGIRVQFAAGCARRAEGVVIDWVDDARGRGLVITNPNAPPPVRDLTPMEAASKLAAGTVTLVDVRPPDERAFAAVKATYLTLDHGVGALERQARDTPLAFLCHHGQRSREAAEYFRQLGFTTVYNVSGGIDAWAMMDTAVPRY